MVCYQVLCIVKPLAAARCSQIRYQAVAVWTGSDKNMPQVGHLGRFLPLHCCRFLRNLERCSIRGSGVRRWE